MIQKSINYSCQNQAAKKAYVNPFSIQISRECDAEDKNVDLQKMCKNTVFFCEFLEHELMSTKNKKDLESDLKQHQKSFPKSSIFE